MEPSADGLPGEGLSGKRVALVGRLASMSKRQAAQILRRAGATVVERPDPSTHLVVLGEEGYPLSQEIDPDAWCDAATRRAVESGTVEVIRESHLWARLGLVDASSDIHRLYTPAMLAELLHVPLSVVRRWHRRGLIVPVREVRRLPYFDFREVATARRLAKLLAAGMSPGAIERKLAALARWLPDVARPLAQLSVIVRGREIFLRQGDGLIEPGGQLRFDFEAAEAEELARPEVDPRDAALLPALGCPPRVPAGQEASLPLAPAHPGEDAALASAVSGEDQPGPSPHDLAAAAAALEDQGHLAEAAEMYRAAMAAGGPTPELCFQLAEVLYRLGDLGGARERYFMAIELDEDYVEARANLGCVLAETGQPELALAAFQGALAYHPQYADVHYHRARLLDHLGRRQEAEASWRAFLELAPDSPWADHARNRLGLQGDPP